MKKCVVIFFAFLLMGCATQQKMQPLPVFEIQKGATIGVINLLSPKMKQYHIGTTVFNNFEKEHDVDWDLPGFINNEFSRQASKMGYQTAIIIPDETLKAKLPELSVKNGDKYVLNPEAVPLLEKLAGEYDIDMLYVIMPFEATIFIPNIDVRVESYGVATRNMLMIGGVEAFAMIQGAAVCMEPLSLTKGWACCNKKDVTGLKMVGNFRSLTEDEKAEYGKVIMGFVDEFVANMLSNSNLKG